jgi:hypothetical protein
MKGKECFLDKAIEEIMNREDLLCIDDNGLDLSLFSPFYLKSLSFIPASLIDLRNGVSIALESSNSQSSLY